MKNLPSQPKAALFHLLFPERVLTLVGCNFSLILVLKLKKAVNKRPVH